MTSRLLAIAALAVLAPSLASAEGLSDRELKKAVRQADKAFAAGQTDEAAELYDRVLASTPPGDGWRESALYALALIRLAAEGERFDLEAARAYLDELATSFPSHPRRAEIAAARGLLAAHDAAGAASARRAAELEAQITDLEAERSAAEAAREEIAGESEAAGDKVKSLEAQLRRMRAERNECRTELGKKDEALQKLKDALVARAGGSG